MLIQRDTGPGPQPPAPSATRSFTMTPMDRARLYTCTRFLTRFGPALSGETFAVFLLPAAPRPGCA